MLKKKGSLNLSINAIVVLIMAITMLGLGLGFINSMFGGTTQKLEGMTAGLDQGVKDALAASVDRVSLSATTVDATKGKSTQIFFAVRNDLDAASGTGTFDLTKAAQAIYCDTAIDSSAMEPGRVTDINGVSVINTIDFETFPEVKLDPGESKVMPLLIKPKSSAVSTIYGCHIDVCNPVLGSGAVDPSSNSEMCKNTDSYYTIDFEINVK
jgi:hypothetical protein